MSQLIITQFLYNTRETVNFKRLGFAQLLSNVMYYCDYLKFLILYTMAQVLAKKKYITLFIIIKTVFLEKRNIQRRYT